MPFNPELKVVGWTSAYPSVQKYLNYLKKEKKIASSEEAVASSLDTIALLCEAAGQNPDEIVAALKADKTRSTYYFDLGKKRLSQLGANERATSFWEACFMMFMFENHLV